MTRKSHQYKTFFFWTLVILVLMVSGIMAVRKYVSQPGLTPEMMEVPQPQAVPQPAPQPAPPPPAQTRKQLLDEPLIEYGSLDIDGNFDLNLSQVTVCPFDGAEKIPIDRVSVQGVDLLHQPPHRLKITLTGVTLTPNALPGQFGQFLRDLDYPQVRADLDLRFKYLAETREFLLERFVLDIPEAGVLTLQGHLGRVPWEMLGDSENLLVFLMKIPNMTLTALELKFVNQGLVQRLMDQQSGQQGLSRDKYLAEICKQIDHETGYVKTEDGRRIINTVKDFLKSPGELEVTARADEPLALGDLPAQWDTFKESGRLDLVVAGRPAKPELHSRARAEAD